MLNLKIKEYEAGNKLSKFDLIKQLTPLKKQNEFQFLNEVFSQPLVQSVSNVDNAFINFFKKYNKFPKFKSRKARRSF